MRIRFENFNSPKNLLICLLFLSSSLLAQQSSSSPSTIPASNPNQIAILRWYRANQTARFAVGNGPGQVAFDGSNIWVTNSSSNTVTKLQASDGTVLGNFAAG